MITHCYSHKQGSKIMSKRNSSNMTRIFTEEDVEDFYGLRVSVLKRLRATNEGPPYRKIGKAFYYLPEEIEVYLDMMRVMPTKENPEEMERRLRFVKTLIYKGFGHWLNAIERKGKSYDTSLLAE